MSANRSTLTLSRPLDRLTAERLELAGVGQAPPEPELQAPPPDGAHRRHVPADADTLAWNRAREAAWHAAPGALEALLRELAPLAFSDHPPPLAIGVDGALIALLAGEFEASVISRFLRDWTRRPSYLEAVARGEVRRDLDGHPTAAPADSASVFAAVLLKRRGVGAMMRFATRPRINWGPLPSPRRRYNWCGLCQRRSGPLFDVPDRVWLHYVGHEQRHQILCIGCWRWLTNVIDGSTFEHEHGGPVSLWSREFRRRHGIPPVQRSPWDGSTEAEAPPS